MGAERSVMLFGTHGRLWRSGREFGGHSPYFPPGDSSYTRRVRGPWIALMAIAGCAAQPGASEQRLDTRAHRPACEDPERSFDAQDRDGKVFARHRRLADGETSEWRYLDPGGHTILIEE